MSEETKQRIIEAGAELVHQRGFNNTGLKDILRAADVPKGSFYFYFDNKEAFGIELVNYYREQGRALTREYLYNEGVSPLTRLKDVLMFFHRHFESYGFTRGCPIGNMAQEMGDLSEPIRASLKEALDGLAGLIKGLLDQALEAGEVPESLNTEEASIFIVEAWHGAIVRMKATKDGEPLNICYKFIFDKVLV